MNTFEATYLGNVILPGKVEPVRIAIDPEDGLEVADGILHVLILCQLRLVAELLRGQLNGDEHVRTLMSE